MPVSYTIKIQVWAAAGGHCCKCKSNLIKELTGNTNKSSQGEVAHIEGENDGAKRYNKNQKENERNSYPNLMLMCPTCHTEIDNDELKYTVPILIKMKSDHEKWVSRQLASASINISFAELEVILKYLLNSSSFSNETNFKLITPIEKISKNKLSTSVSDFITMGMLRTELVKDYLNRNPDVNFAVRLRNGFINKYQELKVSLSGDELFYAILDFASGSSSEFINQATALTVVVYFFQICDIFES